MSKNPPLLPDEVLRRVLRLAHLDGTGLLAIAGGFALISAWFHDPVGTVAGVLVAGAGAIELHGAGLIRNGRERGTNWLIASQFYLMIVIFGYVDWQLNHVDAALLAPLITDDLRQQFEQYHWTDAQFVHFLYVGFYELVAILTVFYQGGMAVYYARRRGRVIAALHEIHGRES
jgi:hypothetical protein